MLHVAGERARRTLGVELRILGVPDPIVSDPRRWMQTLGSGVDSESGWSCQSLRPKQAARLQELLAMTRLDPREHDLLPALAQRARSWDPQSD